MMNASRSFATALILAALAGGARAQTDILTLARYDVQNVVGGTAATVPAALISNPPVTSATALSRVGLSPQGTAGNGWGSNGYTTAGSIDTSQYLSFSLTAGANGLRFTTITWTDSRTATGPTQLAIRSSHNGFSSNLPINNSAIPSGPTARTVNLAGLFLVGASQTIEFRIYGWAAASSGSGAGYFMASTPLTIFGAAAPEPGSAALALLALPALALLRRRR